MLQIAEMEQLSAKLTREVTDLAMGVVLIACRFTIGEEVEEPLPVPLHWRARDWSKPPLDIALDAETGYLRSLDLILQDETIKLEKLLDIEVPVSGSKAGIPVFERTP